MVSGPGPSAPVSIGIVEKGNELWAGLAYGSRASVNSLAITALSELVTDGDRVEVSTWLSDNKASIFADLRQRGGEVGAQWIERNRALIESRRWEDVFIPRYVFGDYLKHKVTSAVNAATRQRTADVQALFGEAVKIIPNKPDFTVSIQTTDRVIHHLNAGSVVLATGIDSYSSLTPLLRGALPNTLIIDDLYNVSLDANLDNIKQHFCCRPERRKRLLVLGSNASALEVLYHVSHNTMLRQVTEKVVVLSTSGRLPAGLSSRERAPSTEVSWLSDVRDAVPLGPVAVVRAAERVVDWQPFVDLQDGQFIVDLDRFVQQSLSRTTDAERREFQDHFGMRFTRLLRRAGLEYRRAAASLAASAQLEIIRGRAIGLGPEKAAGVTLEYETADGKVITHPELFSAVINCRGFDTLGQTGASRLIRTLIDEGVCTINHTGRGFQVDDRLQACRNLFVVGPLLAGVFNTRLRGWHFETSRRIHYAAEIAATAIASSLAPRVGDAR